jgi:hypothetical protein
MSMLRTIRCAVGWHSWEPPVGEVGGARHTCLYCGRTKAVNTGRPPDAHDKSGIHS